MNIISGRAADTHPFQRYQDQIRKRRLSAAPGCEVAQSENLIRYAGAGPECQQNYVLFANFESDIDKQIDEQFQYFSDLKRSWMWTFYDNDSPADLADRLVKRGMKIKSVEHLMTLDLDSINFSISKNFEISRIETAEQLKLLDELFKVVWDDTYPWVRNVVSQAVINSSKNFEVYLLSKDGKPLSAGWMRFHDDTDFASLWGGMTLPGYRGEGLYTEVAKARCIRAQERGFKSMWVGAWPTSRNALERFGFSEQTKITNYVYDSASRP